MNETLVPSEIMSHQALQHSDNLFNDSAGDEFAEFMNLSTIGTGPIPSSGNSTNAKGNRTAASVDLEQQLSNMQSENAKLRQMISTTEKSQANSQDQRQSLFRQMNNAREMSNSKSGVSGKRKDPTSTTGAILSGNAQAIGGPSIVRTKRSPGGSQSQSYRQSTRLGGPQQRPRLNFSHPVSGTEGTFARSYGRTLLGEMPGHTSQDHLDQSSGEEQEALQALRMELESTRNELQAALERCEELERSPVRSRDPGIQPAVDKEERYCMFFDLIFDYIVEMCTMLHGQGVELPEGILHIYEQVVNMGNAAE